MAEIKGGEKLAAALRKISKQVNKAARVDVGFLENAKYPDGTSIAQVAAWAEFGTKTEPIRSFFRTMVAKESPHWGKDIAGLLKANDFDGEATLKTMGQEIKEELVQSIEDTNSPALSPITLMLRKMRSEGVTITGKSVGEAAARVAAGESTEGVETKALVDSGVMRNSADFRVK